MATNHNYEDDFTILMYKSKKYFLKSQGKQ